MVASSSPVSAQSGLKLRRYNWSNKLFNINIMLALPDDDHSLAKLPNLNKIRIQDVFKDFAKISRFGVQGIIPPKLLFYDL